MIPKNWWSSIHLPDATGNLPVLFALFVHAGDFVQQINGNVWRLPMLHVNVTIDEEPRRTKFCIESKAEGLKIAKKYSGWNFQGMDKESEKTDGEEKTKVRHGSTEDTWDGTQNSELLANDSVFLVGDETLVFSMYFVGSIFENSAFGSTHVLFVLGICLLLASRSMVHLVSTKRGAEAKRGERISATHKLQENMVISKLDRSLYEFICEVRYGKVYDSYDSWS